MGFAAPIFVALLCSCPLCCLLLLLCRSPLLVVTKEQIEEPVYSRHLLVYSIIGSVDPWAAIVINPCLAVVIGNHRISDGNSAGTYKIALTLL